MRLDFTCPSCGNGVIKQSVCSIERLSSLWVSGDGKVEVDHVSQPSSQEPEFSCDRCGLVLEEHGKPVSTMHDLMQWMQMNCQGHQ